MPKQTWPPELVDQLRDMHGRGITLQVIADTLGFTRNAIAAFKEAAAKR
jgi:hypothetical protein